MGYIRQGKVKFAIRMASLPQSFINVDGKTILRNWDHIEITYNALDAEGMKILNELEGDIEVLSLNGNYIFSGAKMMSVSERTALMSFDSYRTVESSDPWDEYIV